VIARDPRIFAVMVVKNEVDIIQSCIEHAASFCSGIGVIDRSSDDGTWEVLQVIAKRIPQVLLMRTELPFSDYLRSIPFYALRDRMRTGDWILQLNADEFLQGAPLQLVKAAARAMCGKIWVKQVQFQFTDRDLIVWREGKETLADRRRPIWERRKYYKIDWSEPRLCRYRAGLEWHQSQSWPKRTGPAYRIRPYNLHFQYRDPVQMKERVKERLKAKQEDLRPWSHVTSCDWKDYVCPATECERWDGLHFKERWPLRCHTNGTFKRVCGMAFQLLVTLKALLNGESQNKAQAPQDSQIGIPGLIEGRAGVRCY